MARPPFAAYVLRMRLALGVLCAVAGSAEATPRTKPMAPFDPGLGSVSISSEETTKSVRRVYAGMIDSIVDDPKDPSSHVVTIHGTLERFASDDPRGEHPLPVDKTTPGRDRITVALPSSSHFHSRSVTRSTQRCRASGSGGWPGTTRPRSPDPTESR